MRLVAPSFKREAVAAIAILVLGVVVCLLAAGDSSARPAHRAPTAVIPNGTYGALSPRGEYVVFEVRNRKVRNLNFNMQITCQAPDSPSEQRFFSGGARAPEGRTIPANGKLILNWQEDGGGRYGQVHVELKFGVRDIANFAVIVPEDRSGAGPEDARESCDGVSAQRFHRGFELTPPVLP
ncbi:MAG TPA: hypothetical protein VFX85_10390 [Solirubrobacterales bacterium]|nr:hypothetical protein [Solirubrobacterales bacterium]